MREEYWIFSIFWKFGWEEGFSFGSGGRYF